MLTENDLHWQARQSGGASTTDRCSHYLSNLSISISSRVSVSLLCYSLLAFALRYSAALAEAWPARTVPRFASHTLATPRIASIPIARLTCASTVLLAAIGDLKPISRHLRCAPRCVMRLMKFRMSGEHSPCAPIASPSQRAKDMKCRVTWPSFPLLRCHALCILFIYFACFVQELTVHFVLFGAVYFSLCQQYLCTFGNVQARRSR